MKKVEKWELYMNGCEECDWNDKELKIEYDNDVDAYMDYLLEGYEVAAIKPSNKHGNDSCGWWDVKEKLCLFDQELYADRPEIKNKKEYVHYIKSLRKFGQTLVDALNAANITKIY